MANVAWRCSQCGAINEPGTRACHGCGKWPSLFDLQQPVEGPELDDLASFDVEPFEVEAFEPETFDESAGPDDEPEQPRWKSILSGIVVPLALLVYFAISYFADR
jgi:predicted ATP-dependent serine protease